MIQYPSIQGPNKAPHLPCMAFYKHDGSNLRWEWRRKKGWSKFGTRGCLFDRTHEVFGSAIDIFMRKYAEGIERIILDSKEYRNALYVTAFTEFFGVNSFAGQHVRDDPKDLILFDIQVCKKGILGPREFLRNFGSLHIPRVVYEGQLNQSFIDAIKTSAPGDGMFDLNEGVICKGGSGHDLWFRKVKTLKYLERLKQAFPSKWEELWE